MNSRSRHQHHTSRNEHRSSESGRHQADSRDQTSNNHVRSWLAQVSNSSLDPVHSPRQYLEDDDQHITSNWRPFNIPVTHYPRQTLSRARSTRPSSPFIPTSPPRPRESRKYHQLTSEVVDEYDYKKRRRPQRSSDETSNYSRSDISVYEKPPRRKTREDKYDTKKQDGEKEPGSKRKRQRTKEKKRAQIRPGRDIMSNFVSDAISAKRVTVSLVPSTRKQRCPARFNQCLDETQSDSRFIHKRQDILREPVYVLIEC